MTTTIFRLIRIMSTTSFFSLVLATCFGMLLTAKTATAQYYYRDVVNLQQTASQFQKIKKENVKKVTIKSYEGDKEITDGIECSQRISFNPDKIITLTKAPLTGASYLTSYFNTQGLLEKTTDSSAMNISETVYTYDATKKITAITSSSKGDGISNIEVHQWKYNATGKPTGMLRIRNGLDTTLVSFVFDEKGNIAEEHVDHKYIPLPTVYYYYDEANRLTDVVRYNNKVKKMLPDYIFEYENGNIAIATIVPEGSNDYQKWYYKYDDEGLKIAEFCYNKKNELRGRIEYEYTTN
jgi:hypothetical protein